MAYKKLLIDADSIVYKIAWACENVHYLYKGKKFENKKAALLAQTSDGDTSFPIVRKIAPEKESMVWATLTSFVEGILDPFGPIPNTFYIGLGKSHRVDWATRLPYKGNRGYLHKPTHYNYVRRQMAELYDTTHSREGWESDDEVAYAASENKEAIILSIDKDLLQVPGNHYNFDTKEFTMISEFDGIKRLCAQMLTGDFTDNVLGIAGVGEKSKQVADILAADRIETIFQSLIALYQMHYGCYAFQFLRESFLLLRLFSANPTEYERYLMDKLNIDYFYF